MEYLVQGWNQYNFLLSPEAMRRILTPYHIVVVGQHVETGYTESSLEETLARYCVLYELLLFCHCTRSTSISPTFSSLQSAL